MKLRRQLNTNQQVEDPEADQKNNGETRISKLR